MVFWFTAGFYAEHDGCCQVFVCFCVPGAKGVGKVLSPKTRDSHLLRPMRAEWKQSLSFCSLYFCSSILGTSPLFITLKYTEQTAPPKDGAESIPFLKLSSQCLANFKNKPCLAVLNFTKPHSKPLASSYAPATQWRPKIPSKAFKATRTDRHFYLWRLGQDEVFTPAPWHSFLHTLNPCLHRKRTQQNIKHPKLIERAFCSSLLKPARPSVIC